MRLPRIPEAQRNEQSIAQIERMELTNGKNAGPNSRQKIGRVKGTDEVGPSRRLAGAEVWRPRVR